MTSSSDFLRALDRRDRACNIDPPTSSYAIMRRARPYRGENSEPSSTESLILKPGIREHNRHRTDVQQCSRSGRYRVKNGHDWSAPRELDSFMRRF